MRWVINSCGLLSPAALPPVECCIRSNENASDLVMALLEAAGVLPRPRPLPGAFYESPYATKFGCKLYDTESVSGVHIYAILCVTGATSMLCARYPYWSIDMADYPVAVHRKRVQMPFYLERGK